MFLVNFAGDCKQEQLAHVKKLNETLSLMVNLVGSYYTGTETHLLYHLLCMHSSYTSRVCP